MVKIESQNEFSWKRPQEVICSTVPFDVELACCIMNSIAVQWVVWWIPNWSRWHQIPVLWQRNKSCLLRI